MLFTKKHCEDDDDDVEKEEKEEEDLGWYQGLLMHNPSVVVRRTGQKRKQKRPEKITGHRQGTDTFPTMKLDETIAWTFSGDREFPTKAVGAPQQNAGRLTQ